MGYVRTRPTMTSLIAPGRTVAALNGLNLAANGISPFGCVYRHRRRVSRVHRLTADRYQAEVPLEVEVFDFGYRQKSCVAPANAPGIRYHNVSTG